MIKISKKSLFGTILLVLISLKTANASYIMHVPLESQNGGNLPKNSIVMGGNNTSNPPDKDPNPIDPNPTDDVTCQYDIDAPSFWIEETNIVNGKEVVTIGAMYYAVRIENGFRGAEQPKSDINNLPNFKHFEICFRGEPIWAPEVFH